MQDLISIVESGELQNGPVTRRDIKVAESIFGPDEGILKGKTVYKSGSAIRAESVSIPSHTMDFYRDVVVSADIMKVNGVAFFVSISRNLLFGTTEHISNNKAPTLQTSLKQIHGIMCGGDSEWWSTFWTDNLHPWRDKFVVSCELTVILLLAVPTPLRLKDTFVPLKNGLDVYTTRNLLDLFLFVC